MLQWALRAELLHGGPRTIGTFVEVLAPWETLRAVPTAPKRGRREATSMPKRRKKTCQKGGRDRALNKVGIATLSWSPVGTRFLPSWTLGCPFGSHLATQWPQGGPTIPHFGNRVDINGSKWRFWIETDTESQTEPKVEPNMYGF